ncbi:hypothetical protein LTS18_004567 [Coniosporium uncinatum]|uniref:Uncharacterized protein n=1 Tax=Coniosporium uncinatum TaxID=93489 RepID=A0ACC3D5J3_9PEZI|nr:hypothetical protein LTS18_004567 [Coniosporium uncinatum]
MSEAPPPYQSGPGGSIHERIAAAAPQNASLLSTLSNTDYAPSALKEHNSYIADLNKDLSTTAKQIASLESKVKKEYKEHEAYRDSKFKKFAHGLGGSKGKEKFAAKADKEEREFIEAWQAEREAKEKQKTLQERLNEANQSKAQLEADTKRHEQAQKELDALYNSIFAGPTPEFPEEDQKEYTLNQQRDAFTQAQSRANAEHHAVENLQGATRAMRQALASLDEARSHSTMDMFGGGTLSDMMERNALSAAASAVQQVRWQVDSARKVSSQVQDVGPMDIAQGNFLGDVLFDNIFSDMAMHDKIKDSQAQVQRASQRLGQELERARGREGDLAKGYNAAKMRLEEARRGLQDERASAFQRVGGR